jgi:hypothetical protein
VGVVGHTCHPSYPGSVKRRISVHAGLGINARLYLKNTSSKKGWVYGLAQLLKHLPGELKTPRSISGLPKENKHYFMVCTKI